MLSFPLSMNRFIIYICLIFLLGCAEPKSRSIKEESFVKIKPSEIIKKQEQIPPIKIPKKKKITLKKKIPKKGKLYSLVFYNAKLGDILNLIASESKMNLSVDSEVDLNRPITVRLNKVTLRDALDLIVKRAAGYTWEIKGNFIFIKRFEEYIYHFDYINLIGKTDVEVGGDMLASGIGLTGGGGGGAGEEVKGKYKIEVKSYGEGTDIWDSIKKSLDLLKSPDGIVRIDKVAGLIYMKDTPSRIDSMVRFLDNLSKSLKKQVIINATVLEVTLSDESKYGIDWNEMEIAFKSKWGGLPDDMHINFNNGSIVLSKRSSLRAVLDFLRTKGDVSILSNPHLSVLNGQSALITVGYQYPYGDIEGVDRDTETGLITYGTTIKRAVLGLQLGITPRITEDGTIVLHIVPTITRIQRTTEVDVPIAAGQVQKISNPVIDLQELATSVMLKDGQTLVLGGLISQIKEIERKGLPFLSDIPILGRVFRRTEEKKRNRELVVFITPHILR